MTVTVQAETRYKSWIVPNFIGMETPVGVRQDCLKPLPTVSVKDVSVEVLDAMAADFLNELYVKAGKANKWKMMK